MQLWTMQVQEKEIILTPNYYGYKFTYQQPSWSGLTDSGWGVLKEQKGMYQNVEEWVVSSMS